MLDGSSTRTAGSGVNSRKPESAPVDEPRGHPRRPLGFRVQGVSEADKEVLRLVAWEGVSPAEGAFVFECSVTTFKVRLHRARRRLVRLLDKDEAGDAPRDAAEIALVARQAIRRRCISAQTRPRCLPI